MPELLVENVSKQFPTRAEPLEVLRGVSLELDAGLKLLSETVEIAAQAVEVAARHPPVSVGQLGRPKPSLVDPLFDSDAGHAELAADRVG